MKIECKPSSSMTLDEIVQEEAYLSKVKSLTRKITIWHTNDVEVVERSYKDMIYCLIQAMRCRGVLFTEEEIQIIREELDL